MLYRKEKIDWQKFYSGLDYEALYDGIGWCPTYSSGSEDKGHCLDPWQFHKHGDRTGKLAINRDKGVYNCWVCGGGTILNLVMEVKSLDYDGAIEFLSKFITAFSKESSEEFNSRVAKLLTYTKDANRPLPSFNPRVLSRYGDGTGWGRERGIFKEVIERFSICVDVSHSKFHPDHGSFEGSAAILPHFWHGKLVGWQERWISETPKWIGRWTNTSDFPRETTVWGYDHAVSQDQRVILVESVPTALRLISHGYPAIATFGSQLTPDQCKHLRVFSQGLTLAPDNDVAGYKWYSTAIKQLDRHIPLTMIKPSGEIGDDLGDLTEDAFLSAVADVKDIFTDYIIEED